MTKSRIYFGLFFVLEIYHVVAWIPCNLRIPVRIERSTGIPRLPAGGFHQERWALSSSVPPHGRRRTLLHVKAKEDDSKSNHLQQLFQNFAKSLGKGILFAIPINPTVTHALFGIKPSRKNQGAKDSVPTKTVSFTLREGLAAIAIYLGIGVAGYHFLLGEHWSIFDSIYFAITSFTSVGYGDLIPHTAASKIFTIFFSLGGIAFLAAALASIGSQLAQAELQTVQAAQKVRRVRVFQFLDRMRKQKAKRRRENTLVTAVVPFRPPEATGEVALPQTPKTNLQICLKALRKLIVPILFLWSGGIIMGRLEGWSVLDSVYYSTITASTLGLGDLSPTSQTARIAAVFFIPLAVASGGEILSILASALLERRRSQIFENFVQKDFTMDHIKAMDNDGDGIVSQLEYTEFMLVEMKLVEKSVLDELREQFDRLDMDHSGRLSKEDLILMAKQRRKMASEEINGDAPAVNGGDSSVI